MTRLLLVLCGALVVVIAAEIVTGQGAGGEFGPPAAMVPPGALARSTSRPAEQDRARWVAVILDRPLFSPDRRPAPGAPIAVAAAGVPRLTGIIMTPDRAVAIFRDDEGAKPLVEGPGGSVGGWVIATIAADGVSLRKVDARITVRPEFDASSATPAGGPVQQEISRWITPAPTGLLRARWSNPQLQP
jgi:hypothetical protein